MDTGIVAKTKRVSTKWEEFMRKMSYQAERRPRRFRQKKIVRRCKQCAYKVRSINPVYVKIQDGAAHGGGASVIRAPEGI